MFHCYLSGGRFLPGTACDLESVLSNLDRDHLYYIPTEHLLGFMEKFGKELSRRLLAEEGIYYLVTWLRRSNLRSYLDLNLGGEAVLDRFVLKAGDLYLRAQPRGIVGHWVAGNVPTLSIFSLVQSMLAKNANIIRVPMGALDGTLRILRILGQVTVNAGGNTVSGEDLLKSISVVYCPSTDLKANTELSLSTDCKVVWGGAEAVKSIVALPQKEHCENIVFGPKYSFAVMDAESIQEECLRRLAIDIITFQQEACSSPHVVFCETQNGRKGETVGRLADHLARAFEYVTKKFPKPVMAYSDVMNIRGKYWLDPEKQIVCSDPLDWTILVNDDLQLEEPVKYRTIFVKEVDSILDTIPLITNKIQTVGVSIHDREKRLEFCEKATHKGVARCVPFGTMNNYDTPWDGMMFMDRLVRWTSCRE